MNARQLCVVSIAVAATLAAVAPLAAATGSPAAMREVAAIATLGALGEGSGPAEMRGVPQPATTVALSWWWRWD